MNKQKDIRVFVMKLSWDGIMIKIIINGDAILEKKKKKLKKVM